MIKEAGAYRTISEVAAELDLPQHVLRFWETRFPLIRPLKRAGGRRFYRPVDVALLRDIRTKLYDEGYTIKGVQRLLRERGGRAGTAVAGMVGDGPAPGDGVINDDSAGGDAVERRADDVDVCAAQVIVQGAAETPPLPPIPTRTLTDFPAAGGGGAAALAALREALALVESCERRLRVALDASR